MKKKLFAVVLFTAMLLMLGRPTFASASENGLLDYVEQTIENDREILSNLSPALEKLYKAAIKAFKKAGTLSKEISDVVKLFNDLDEKDEDYEKKLAEFFDKYNELSPFRRKVVDAITGLLDMKDTLLDSITHSVIVDMYSTKKLECGMSGSLNYQVENETVIKVDNGLIIPSSIGYSALTVSDAAGEEIVYRVFVKKPVLSSTVSVKKNKTVTVKLPTDKTITDIHISSSKKITCDRNGYEITVTGLKKGTAYVYVGTESGSTMKYKIKIK
ncbi:MAG: hypothetical protein K6E85_05090 [Lachnospiraceae bacterium]|nr:hypothetical protein [Lachnospiraceae bacterium]